LTEHAIEGNPREAVGLRRCNVYDPNTQARVGLQIADVHEGYLLCVRGPFDGDDLGIYRQTIMAIYLPCGKA
jgi:hypothetical protein